MNAWNRPVARHLESHERFLVSALENFQGRPLQPRSLRRGDGGAAEVDGGNTPGVPAGRRRCEARRRLSSATVRREKKRRRRLGTDDDCQPIGAQETFF